MTSMYAARDKINGMVEQAIKYKLDKYKLLHDEYQNNYPMFIPRSYKNVPYLTITHKYGNISTLSEGGKLMSPQLYFNGYHFHCYLRLAVKEQCTSLHGYVSCTIPNAICASVPHCLPCLITMIISKSDNTKFNWCSNNTTFVLFTLSIGGSILEPGVTWEDVKSGNSSMVIDDCIHITTTIRLLNSTEGCIKGAII